MVNDRVEKVSCQGRQIRNPGGVECAVGVVCDGFPCFEHLVLLFLSFFFLSVNRDMLPRKHVVCV